jgi:hypothetical protein
MPWVVFGKRLAFSTRKQPHDFTLPRFTLGTAALCRRPHSHRKSHLSTFLMRLRNLIATSRPYLWPAAIGGLLERREGAARVIMMFWSTLDEVMLRNNTATSGALLARSHSFSMANPLLTFVLKDHLRGGTAMFRSNL